MLKTKTMTDSKLLKLSQKASIAVSKAHLAIIEADEAYSKRFNVLPSEMDNDGWIDTVHYGRSVYNDIKEIIDDHNLHNK